MTNLASPELSGNSEPAELEFHPLANLFPLMEGPELDAFAADIKAHGLRESITLHEDKILDGRNRYRACIAAGIEPTFANYGGSNPVGYVLSANVHRRHLTAEQKHDLIVKLLKMLPETSNRQIAKTAKMDDKTVGAVRAELESTAEIPQLEKTVGADGKARKRPAKKTKSTTAAAQCRECREAKDRQKAEQLCKKWEEAKAGAELLAVNLIKADHNLARQLCDLLESGDVYDFYVALCRGLDEIGNADAPETSADDMKARFAEMESETENISAANPDAGMPKKRGRPKGSKNKLKPPTAPATDVPAPTLEPDVAPRDPVLGNDPGPLPEFLDRAPGSNGMSGNTDRKAAVNERRQLIQKALAELIEEGLVEHTGEFRNGRPVYRTTDLGRAKFLREQGRLQ